ncbi:hypothetical protein A3B02_02660 [Candidatus Roizmanbacteria bacterium RIFCSPLOWO2_01_FULL_42_14]|uniref:Glycosyltransferase 2-like domain-containing protein n=4 Tax=Candidatus Roizmaniibacteriota TaxID=1752723 RepID=A0A1F7JUF6_9BACT|nr:MAG: hypothetical protein A3D08_00945 [Candidatus Roizmanbacteria bacterium RIFCSPHIGHO2_02_FULL_43_11]OGK38880.1 MAG: hypothetical protein A3F32_01650 [Candidatus Roizmanbacteria bacterium RIFCSPHIGHO2_12_FULL_42_10]OGK51476.1 MAG: hypothetical protein A3B02_02660 [Candidatus Roizmanbacteria bacterium RIFCSPLOWO2_01_FULL_42_14]OGK59230.1 MAG: hypothetical protein A3I56_03140 [Candidatus Roizmanbacteria bacterium RIFCSPLOWO2_02_FULL_43_10]
MNKTRVSVIIPVLEINDYILDENLPAHARLTFKDFEVIVLPNTLPHNHAKIVQKYPWLRIIPTGSITRPALKRDIGAEAAKGDILAFIDDDAYPARSWLSQAMTLFEKENIMAVCGPGVLPSYTNIWEKVFDEIFKSWVGSGGFAYRFTKAPARYVDDYPSMNFLVRKDIFKKLGGFNNDFWPGEDSKLCEDIVYTLGGKILYSPLVLVHHHRRSDIPGYLRQHARYGFHRGAFFSHGDKNSRHVAYLVPAFFVIYLAGLILSFSFFSSMWPVVLSPLLLYIFLLFNLGSHAYSHTKSLKIAHLSAIVLFLTHMVYGIQFIKGFFVGLLRQENIYGKK